MIDDPAAREHVAARLGRRPGRRCPARASPPSSCSRSLGTDGRPARPARARLQPAASAPPTPAASPSASRALDLLVVCDFVPSETALLADVVLPVTQWAEEEGTMTSLEGRVLRRRRAHRAARRGAQRAVGLVRAGPPARLRRAPGAPTRPRCSTSCARASAGGRADYSGLSHARLDADGGRCTGRAPRPPTAQARHPGHAAAVRRPLPHAGRPGPPGRRRPPRARATTCARTPRSTWSPGGCCSTTSPAPRPAGSPSSAAAVPGPYRRDAPAARGPPRRRRRATACG